MPLVDLGSTKALGFDMPDHRYNTRPDSGYVEVSDRHAAMVRANTGLSVYDTRIPTFSHAPGSICQGCGFHQFTALTDGPCSRCGGNEWQPE